MPQEKLASGPIDIQPESATKPSSEQRFSPSGFILHSLEKHQGFIIGESFKSKSAKTYLDDFMYLFKNCGVKTIFMHHLLQDCQPWLDEYFKSSDPDLKRFPQLFEYLRGLALKQNLRENSTFISLIKAAKKNGIRVVALDTPETYYEGSLLLGDGLEQLKKTSQQYKKMNEGMCKIISKNATDGKYVVLVEAGQVANFMKTEGMSEILNCPHVVIDDLMVSNQCESYQENFDVKVRGSGTLVTRFDVFYKRHSLDAQYVEPKPISERGKTAPDVQKNEASSPVELPSDSSPSAPLSNESFSAKPLKVLSSLANTSRPERPPSGSAASFPEGSEPDSQDMNVEDRLSKQRAENERLRVSTEKKQIKDMIMDEIGHLTDFIKDSTNNRKTKWGVKKKTENLKAIASWLNEHELNNPSQVLGVIYDVCAVHRHPALFGGWGKTHSVKEFSDWFEGHFKRFHPQVQLPTTHADLKDLRDPTSIKALLDGLNAVASKKPTSSNQKG